MDDEKAVCLVTDTAADDTWRRIYLRNMDGLALCYSIGSRNSFNEAKRIFDLAVEVKEGNYFPVVILALQTDRYEHDPYHCIPGECDPECERIPLDGKCPNYLSDSQTL